MLIRMVWVVLIGLSVVPRYAVAGNILILGDSLSAALGIELDQGWVNLLQKKLHADEAFAHWQLINASISGETSAGGLARLPKLLQNHRPRLCVLELGANDGLRGQSTKRLRQNVETMIKQCKAANSEVLLLGIVLPPNYGKQYRQAFQAVYPALVEKYQLTWVPFFLSGVASDPELMQPDRLHPNAKGQPRIVENVWPTMKSVLQGIH